MTTMRDDLVHWLSQDGWMQFPYRNQRKVDDYVLAPPLGWEQLRSHVVGSYILNKEYRPLIIRTIADSLLAAGWSSQRPDKHQGPAWVLPAPLQKKLQAAPQTWVVKSYTDRLFPILDAMRLQQSMDLGFSMSLVAGDVFLMGNGKHLDMITYYLR